MTSITEKCAAIGGVRVNALSRKQWADCMLRDCLDRKGNAKKPIFVTSLNGHVLSKYHSSGTFREHINQADGIDADGMPIVIASKLFGQTPLPERVATTDFFHDASTVAAQHSLKFFMLGGTAEANKEAMRRIRLSYPSLEITGHHGYIDSTNIEDVRELIKNYQPDVLWVGMGVPLEHKFVAENIHHFDGIGWIKTCGGLIDFLAGNKRRAPRFLQNIGLEWAYRLALEPRRLFWRYAVTNFHAIFIVLVHALPWRRTTMT
ncbi:WecB/TagA/CpsF family glycosyltransferase [Methylobacterium sp. V23]|uniref:WecB/TagA/CpsF family glycosyltransferase n=1 Tax=Methylobacterium sp. V23 TaxID=2044878 RepID=UPI001AECA92D|nr:WecB/TagA/CpsF family glycosyltransferase [Methylobacterium sp. V23]